MDKEKYIKHLETIIKSEKKRFKEYKERVAICLKNNDIESTERGMQDVVITDGKE